MNDRDLFKAKRMNWRELPKEEWWVQGALFDGENRCLIGQEIKFSPYVENECKIVGYEVDRTTICRCTGLLDKGKNLIWENDVVKTGGVLYACYWDECNIDYSLKNKDESFGLGYSAPYLLEVVGNIFDNPELLEVE